MIKRGVPKRFCSKNSFQESFGSGSRGTGEGDKHQGHTAGTAPDQLPGMSSSMTSLGSSMSSTKSEASKKARVVKLTRYGPNRYAHTIE